MRIGAKEWGFGGISYGGFSRGRLLRSFTYPQPPPLLPSSTQTRQPNSIAESKLATDYHESTKL
ncbi:hypothetical protein TorRG33x02_078310 [Trema orientale]|uniref:Uncharacterized protein n=1 Tax=Trema orientale TaxID=63057 RepID=A0A2P5FEL9_TREOI|nr:hypothetical protein TorRG33x02_078310 [Trema orientale]